MKFKDKINTYSVHTFCVENVNCRLPLDSILTELKCSEFILSPNVALIYNNFIFIIIIKFTNW